MKADFPVFEWRVGGFAADELEDVLGGAPLGVLRVEHVAILIEFEDVCENRVNLFESARFAKDAGVVDAFEKRKADGSAGHPIRKGTNGSAHRVAEMWHATDCTARKSLWE
jgi:hypothetical protein